MQLKKFSSLLLPLLFATELLASTKPLVEKPWLHNYTPDAITAYARIPNPKFYFMENDTPLKSLYQNPLYNEFMQLVVHNTLKHINTANIPADAKTAADIILSKLTAPIELMVSDFADGTTPPTLLIATKLDYQDGESFKRDFATFLKGSPMDVRPTSPTTGQLILKQAGVPGQYQYNLKSQRLLISLGMPDPTLMRLISADKANPNTPIKYAETRIDANGQGLFVWLHPNRALLQQLPMRPEQRQTLETLKLDQAEYLAAGFGLGEQRPKVKALVKMPNVGLKQLFPAHSSIANPRYFGHLSWLFSISLPNESQLDTLVSMAMDNNTESYEQYLAGKKTMQAESGIEFSTLMQLIGQQVIVFEDDNGRFMALSGQAEDALDTLLTQLINNDVPLVRNEINVGEHTIYHVSIQKVLEQLVQEGSQNLPPQQKLMLPILSQMYLPSNHFYWIKEDDNLIFSTLPQPLIARQTSTANGTLSQWLESQNITLEGSTLTGTMMFRNLAQKSYYGQLSLLQLLSDMSDTPLEIQQFPSANTIPLPRYGALAMQIHNQGDILSFEYSAENGLMGVWQAMGHSSISTLGILAAIAIPAYQDYTIRAQTAQQAMAEEMLNSTPDEAAATAEVEGAAPQK